MSALRDLDRLPADVRPLVQAFAENVVACLGPQLVCLAVYGSAAGPDYVPGRSNVNLLVVARELSFPTLRSLLPLTTDRRRRRIAPLFLTADYIRRSTDIFPIEFREMRDLHLLLYGEDVLAGIEVRPEDVRVECERELKSHLLKLRQAYLEVGRSRRDVERLLHRALSSLLPIFRHLLELRNVVPPPGREEGIRALGPAFSVDTTPFLAVHRDRRGDARIGGKEVETVFAAFLGELEKLAEQVDRAT